MDIQPHDCIARDAAELEAHILYRNRRFYTAKGSALSSRGMSLAIRNLTLPAGTCVDLEIQRHGRVWLIPAMVIKQDDRRVRVSFLEPQPELPHAFTSFAPRHTPLNRAQPSTAPALGY